MTKLNLVWFRNDLRCFDNQALCSAIDDANKTGAAVGAIFIATKQSWLKHDMAAIKQDLIRRRVRALKHELEALTIPMLCVESDSFEQIPDIFNLLNQHYVLKVFAQNEYEINEVQRDEALSQVLKANGSELILFDTQCVMPPNTVLNQQGQMYKVFTPFKNAWLYKLELEGVRCLAKPKALSDNAFYFPDIPSISLMEYGDESSSLWSVSEQDVLDKMRLFCQSKVHDYHANRDFPAIDGTSMLSAYLAIGVISPSQCIARLQYEQEHSWRLNQTGAHTWLTELIWREFYKHILVAFPKLIKHHPFQEDTAAIRWCNSPELFQAWCEGKTGYPIVDAAMRQLNETGWMHNRLRMITASFLVKDLHIDWRLGERYFMSKLIDGDFAANNGGWQWAASTGTDAAPYFRIFNPVSQSQKFDPKGDFIRAFVPELKSCDNKQVHWPHDSARGVIYTKPIVDHQWARLRTLEMFSSAKKIKDEKNDQVQQNELF